jgi:CDP-diglyceride synthetase
MVAVKADVLSYFKKPIHQRWFGQNKTWRGFLIMPLATWPGVLLALSLESSLDLNAPFLLNEATWLLALCLGLGYCLAELPNSFMKRKLGIKEGQVSSKYKWFFVVVDQADSAFGCMLAYLFFVNVSWGVFWITIIFGTTLHLLLNIILYKLKIRSNPY